MMLERSVHCSQTELLPGIHSVPAGSYVIIDLQDSVFLRIVRVLHGARDLELQFSDTDQP
jgi:plasmid stabilization system protein ParE